MQLSIEENYSLRQHNTFGMEVSAAYFIPVTSIPALQEGLDWIKSKRLDSMILGGGSNVLFTKNPAGAVVHNRLKGIEKIAEDEKHVYIRVGGGEIWHQFVLYCLEQNLAGVENLALIPGSVGASPMQNIGAYGVELREVFQELTAVHRHSLEEIVFSERDCGFGYRDSVFKNKYRNEFVITSVSFRVNKQARFRIEYGAIRQELEKAGVQEPTLKAVADAVIAIRSSKLPDPARIGNAGSFFKNPSVGREKFLELKKYFPGIVGYDNADGTMKLAAGWMIEQCGLKGYRKGDAGVHDQQALVLVNHGNATGAAILEVKNLVMDSVKEKFDVELVPEVNII